MNDDPYSLDKLHGLVEPDPISWWPLAPGWWFVIALLLVWVLAASAMSWIRWRKTAYRRAGLRQLDEIQSSAQSSSDRVRCLWSLSSLLKRVALVAYPRRVVASLSGSEWMEFLQHTAPAVEFTAAPIEAGTASGPQGDQREHVITGSRDLGGTIGHAALNNYLLASASVADPDSIELDATQFAGICEAVRTWIETHDEAIDKC